MITTAVQYIKLIRPANAAITGCATALGIWLTGTRGFGAPLRSTLLLAAAAMAAAAYGNAVNDILDVESDRVSHPSRPLASGALTARAAAALAAALALGSLACAAAASTFHAAAALVPVALLTMYSIYFKRTRVVGNIIVAALTGYALLFGSLPRPETKILFAPALLAVLLNFCREIIKDVQDAEGDRAAGWATSASLPAWGIRAILTSVGAIYIVLMWAPSLMLGDFGMAYNAVCLVAVLPLQIYWMALILRPELEKNAGRAGTALKLEMVAGMAALALDKVFIYFIN